jgi:RimJ/RimL family protein N-acetyltransferase
MLRSCARDEPVQAVSPCTLEPQREAHAAEMFGVLCDPALHEFEGAPPASVAALAERLRRLEAGGPPDGSERWLNWVVRRADGRLAGYVQATLPRAAPGLALIAYVLGSTHWRQGLGSAAVRAMQAELHRHHGVHRFAAVLKAANFRSVALLRSLGFVRADTALEAAWRDEPDEIMMTLAAAAFTHEPAPTPAPEARLAGPHPPGA